MSLDYALWGGVSLPCLRSASWLHVIWRLDPRFRFVLQCDDIDDSVTDSDIDLFADSVVIIVTVVYVPVFGASDE